jgi:hypothetical protein
MLSKQLIVNLDLKNKVSKNTTISEILSNSDMDSVSLYARIRSIPPVKKYKAKDGLMVRFNLFICMMEIIY